MTPSRSKALPRILVVGVGRLGGALARSYQAAGGGVVVHAHSPISSKRAQALGLKPTTAVLTRAAQLCFLAVPDEQLPHAAKQWAPQLGAKAALVHCAGALTLDVLGASRALKGRSRGSFHPLCALSAPSDTLEGHSVALSATDPRLLQNLERVAKALSLEWFFVPESRRAVYHAGAVLAAGAVVALMDAAVKAFEAADIPQSRALQALLPLADSALRGIEQRGLSDGLTGPVVRGDVDAIQRHLKALPVQLRPLYAALTRQALYLATPRLMPGTRAKLARAIR